jgi:hypothetical protein
MIKALSFRKHAPNIATADDIAALETKLNFRFPAVFIELCSRWNGGFLAKDSQFYPVPSTFEEFYKEFGSRDGGVLVSTLFGATDEFVQCSLLRNYNLLNESSNLGIIPIAQDLFGNRAVLRVDSPSGLVYWWDHELWEMLENPSPGGNFPERPYLIPIAENLEFFYNSLTSDPELNPKG